MDNIVLLIGTRELFSMANFETRNLGLHSLNRVMQTGSIIDGKFVLALFKAMAYVVNNESAFTQLLPQVNAVLDIIKVNTYETTQKGDVCTYESPTLGVRFQYNPRDWSVDDSSTPG